MCSPAALLCTAQVPCMFICCNEMETKPLPVIRCRHAVDVFRALEAVAAQVTQSQVPLPPGRLVSRSSMVQAVALVAMLSAAGGIKTLAGKDLQRHS